MRSLDKLFLFASRGLIPPIDSICRLPTTWHLLHAQELAIRAIKIKEHIHKVFAGETKRGHVLADAIGNVDFSCTYVWRHRDCLGA